MDLKLACIGLICAFHLVLFGQSGLDKIFNFKGNKDWILSYFSKSIFAPLSGILFIVIILLELIAAVISGIALFFIIFSQDVSYAGVSFVLSIISLLCLFTGQRLAKDYSGAAALTGYFMVAIAGIILLT